MPLSIVTAGLSMGKHEAREVACLAGAWKQRAQERKVARGRHACLPLVRPFFFAPTFGQAPATQATKEGSAQCKGIWIPESGNFACRIRNTGLWNPKYNSRTPESL